MEGREICKGGFPVCRSVSWCCHSFVQKMLIACIVQDILADKDEKIIDLQQQVMQLREQLIAANMDSEKASVAALTKVCLSSLP